MLCLSRQIGERVRIGSDVVVKVLSVHAPDGRAIVGCKVKLGIEAPRDVSVHRQEIYDAIQREMDSAKEPGLGEDYI